MTYKEILGVIPTMQSVALASSTIKSASNVKKGKKAMKSMIKSATNAMVGASLIKATAGTIGEI